MGWSRRVSAGLALVTALTGFVTGTVPAAAAGAATPGSVVAWGTTSYGESSPPAGLGDVTAIAAGVYFSLALRGDGTVVGWGVNDHGQLNIPPGLSRVTAIAAGEFHGLALESDGKVAAWGTGNVVTLLPSGLEHVTAIAAGRYFGLALKSDGTVTGWGSPGQSAIYPPIGLSHVTAIAAADDFALALKSDGTVVGWGLHVPPVPAGLDHVTAIAAGYNHAVALKSDGTVVAWGDNQYGDTTVPAGLSGVVAIAAGFYHNLALKSDGTVVAWGDNWWDDTTVPTGLGAVTGIAASGHHSLALVGQSGVPNTTIACNGAACLSTAWYRQPVTVSLSAVGSAGSPVAQTVYTTDGSDPSTSTTAVTYSGPFTVDSSATVQFFSIDQAGNREPIRSQPVRLDTTAPATTVDCNDAPCGSDAYGDPVTVTLPAGDTGGSGLATTVYTTDGTNPVTSATARTYTGPFTLTQPAAVKAFSTDTAGNVEPTRSRLVAVGAAPPYTWLVDGRSGLLAHWRLGDTGGGTARDTTGSYNGSYAGGPTLGVAGALANDPDTAAGFNGTNSKVSLPPLPSATDFTIEGWSYLTNAGTVNNTVYGNAGSVRLMARPGKPSTATTAYAGVWLNGTEYALQPAGAAANLNTWVHWVLTRAGGTLTLYRNGIQVGQRSDLPPTAQANLSGSIGMQTNGNFPLTGRIDEVAVNTGALSAAAVSADYTAALTGAAPPPARPADSYRDTVLAEPNLRSYWRLGDSDGWARDSKDANNGSYAYLSNGYEYALGYPSSGGTGVLINDPDGAHVFGGVYDPAAQFPISTVLLPPLAPVGDFTVEGWSYLADTAGTNNTLYGGFGNVRLMVRAGNTTTPTAAYAGVWLGGTEYALQPKSPAPNVDTWVYWVLTRRGNTMTLYRNGVPIGQRTDLSPTALANISGAIGSQGGTCAGPPCRAGGYYLTGRIDEVAVYDAALPASAVTSHYAAALYGPAPK